MSDNSAIEWTDATWNPTVGCSIVSPGCTNCYAMQMAARLEAMGQPAYAGLTQRSKAGAVWTGKVELSNLGQVIKPLSWKKPRRIFVNSMSDLFHESLPDEAIDKVFAVMALCPQHTFQVLTKRAERMRAYIASRSQPGPIGDEAPAVDIRIRMTAHHAPQGKWAQRIAWPLPNVWLGVSTERQQEADERIPLLLQTPAAVRFISAEPLLGPIDLDPFTCRFCHGARWEADKNWSPEHEGEARAGRVEGAGLIPCGHCNQGGWNTKREKALPLLDWIIVGGESGPRARPMHPRWARDLRDQCAAAGVAYFFKQWGEHLPWSQFAGALAVEDHPEQTRFRTAEWCEGQWRDVGYPMWCDSVDGNIDDEQCVGRVGKKSAGHLLDGKEHNEFPQSKSAIGAAA